jgi:hypothetical protein
MFSGLRRRVDWLVEANVLEKRAVLIFSVESPSSALEMEIERFSETSTCIKQSTRRLNPKEHNQKRPINVPTTNETQFI